MEKELIKSSLSNISVSSRPNLMIVNGCIAMIGEASTGSPCGAGGQKVLFTEASVKCAKSFEGMPINCTFPDYTNEYCDDVLSGHGELTIGVVNKVKVKDNELHAEMLIWKDKFPKIAELIMLGMDSLGFSCEWYNTATHEESNGKEVIKCIDEFEGVGVALLWSASAAFSQTYIEKLAACKEEFTNNNGRNDEDMTIEEKQELIKDMVSAMSEVVDAKIKEVVEKVEASKVDVAPLQEKVELISTKIEKNGKAFEDYVLACAEKEQAKIEVEKAEQEKLEAEKIEASVEEVKDVPVPSAVQHVEPNLVVNDKASEIERINASADMTPMEKLRAIAKARMQ